MTEKRRPTYDLGAFQEAFLTGSVNVTGSAIKGAAALGLDLSEMGDVIAGMEASHFYKSMTSYASQKIWQDVYHVPSPAGTVYVKFTADAVAEFTLLSFKEKSGG